MRTLAFIVYPTNTNPTVTALRQECTVLQHSNLQLKQEIKWLLAQARGLKAANTALRKKYLL